MDDLLRRIDPSVNRTTLEKENAKRKNIKASRSIWADVFIFFLLFFLLLLSVLSVLQTFAELNPAVTTTNLICGILYRIVIIVLALAAWKLSISISYKFDAQNRKYRCLIFSLLMVLLNLFGIFTIVSYHILRAWLIPGLPFFNEEGLLSVCWVLSLVFGVMLTAIPGALIFNNWIPSGKLRNYSDNQ